MIFMRKIDKELMKFIDNTPNAYYCIDNLRQILIENGFEELYENESWSELKPYGKYFVVRNDSSLIAFKIPDIKVLGFNIVAAHTDCPSFAIKPNSEMFDGQYLKLNMDSYGGMINYSWLDRPLSLAGRVIVLHNGVYKTQLVNIDKDLLLIPSQAIHINRDVNKKLELNPQVDMLPIMSLTKEKKLEDILREVLEQQGIIVDKICDYDLHLYNRDQAKLMGLHNEFILAPRLDDLACVFPAFQGFINSINSETMNVFCAFNNEEIGSLTQQGADSTFLIDVLARIAHIMKIDFQAVLHNSMMISADNAHALHPNAPSKNDPTNKVLLNQGIAIKHHKNYTTDALTSSLFKSICDYAKVPYQDFAFRSDMLCGSTLGKLSQRHVSIDSIDIGLPQLAMHSAAETIGAKDVLYMYKSLLEFYNTTIVRENNTVKLLHR